MAELPRCYFAGKNLVWKLEKTVAARQEAIGPLVDEIMRMVQMTQCVPGKETEAQLALTEALANAVVHGAGNDPAKQVAVCVGCEDDRGLLIVVRDPGKGFDPSSIPNPVVGQNVYSEHGRGIFLINRLAKEMHFEKGGTEIHVRIG